jgi:hypothetical protein
MSNDEYIISSPWIYHELITSKYIKREKPNVFLNETKQFSSFNDNNYRLDNSHLTPISYSDINDLTGGISGFKKFLLDMNNNVQVL